MNKEQKNEFIRFIIEKETVHFPALCKIMGLEWGDVKTAIASDEQFRREIENQLEKFKFEIYQQCFSRALGRNSVKGAVDLTAIKAALSLIDSGVLVPGSEPSKKASFGGELGDSSGPDLLERIGLRPSDPTDPTDT